MSGKRREPVLAGVDVGTTHCKAVLCTPAGTVLAQAQRRTPVDASGHAHDVAQLCRAALEALAACTAAARRGPDAVGITGMAETGAPLDAQGDPLLPALTWSDPRPAAHAERLRRDHGAAELHEVTGVLPSPKVPLAKWLWLREEHADVVRRMRTWAGAADLVAHALTGAVGTDATFAQRTMAWDVHTGAWRPDLLALAGLDVDRMPAVHAPGTAVGRIGGATAAALGMAPGAPVVVAGHDHLVGAWAAGVRAAGESADSMGTAEAVVTLADTAPDARATGRQGMSYGRHVDGAHWCTVAGMSSSGALVEWFCDRLLGLGQAPPEERYRRFAALVEQAGEGPTGVCVEPYLHGRSAPRPDPARRLTMHGFQPRHGLSELAKALLEGASYQARWMAEAQGELVGAPPHTVTLLGGSVRQRTWSAIKAAVSPWRTLVCDAPDAACLGAAAWAGAALDLDPAAPVAARRPVDPPPAAADAYQRAYHTVFLPTVTTSATAGRSATGPVTDAPL
ncbi:MULTISPECIES: FGGY-family carbohydrate kinase [Streptomyces]|uniref:FGGY family carbohydrate kinase n=1 Tax=Streptomyces flaveolus TaxID=67297 RepID=A0ABV3ANR0_9ACTN|nr:MULTISPECIES: FGGY family carbohydrate kinase [Streptomyces]